VMNELIQDKSTHFFVHVKPQIGLCRCLGGNTTLINLES
jgi:hypothetical protein